MKERCFGVDMMKQQEIYRIFASRGMEGIGKALKQTPDLYTALLSAKDVLPEQMQVCFLVKGYDAYINSDEQRMLAVSEMIAQAYPSAPPLPLLIMQLYLCFHRYDISTAIQHLTAFGEHAIDLQQWNSGCEAIGAAFLLDYHHQHELLVDIAKSQQLMQLYEKTAQHLLRSEEEGTDCYTASGEKLRIGLLVPNLVDDMVAFSKRVHDFVTYADDSIDLFVFSSENACVRNRSIPVPLVSHASAKRAPRLIHRLRERGIPLYILEGSNDFTLAAKQLAKAITRCQLDALFLQSSGAMPIDWLAARLAAVPKKIQIHIGQSMYIPGFSATVFDNSVNMAREQGTWPEFAGRQILIRKGTDVARLSAEPAAKRSDWGLPETAVLIGTLSNWLEERLSDVYLDVIVKVLQSYPAAMYTPVGSENMPEKVRMRFEGAGVIRQVRFIPRQRRVAGVLKMLDIYANEFPAGGSQAVIEAMACGCPVVAMRCGDSHHTSIGADFVGAPWAVDHYDVSAYSELLSRLVADSSMRKEWGMNMCHKARKEYSVKHYIEKLIATV